MPVTLTRGPSRGNATGSIRLAALRVPLAAKLIGANVAVVATLSIVWLASGHAITLAVGATLLAVMILQIMLTFVALRPIRDLEEVVSRVWRGDFGARVERSSVADHEVLRVGTMFNTLLDGLASDRARMRALATEVIEVGDRERAALARELHDSTAQRLAALLLQISTAARDSPDPELRKRLEAARDAAEGIIDEVRVLAQAVHPRVLDDLGLAAALQKLGRDSSHGTGVDVDVVVPASIAALPHPIAAVLYRVAQEAVRNAIRHASPRHVHVQVELGSANVHLEVRDDGCGFDLAGADRDRRGMGLLSMRERVALVDGWLDIRTAERGGTSVHATIPLVPASDTTPSRREHKWTEI